MSTKSIVLELLEKSRDRSLSGEELAGLLGVSRTAVWKAINELKKEGYSIEAVPNRGYRLSPDSDILSVEGMLPYLEQPDLAGQIHLFKEVESTNQSAKQLALDGAADGTAVLAERQTAGKGRQGRAFFSPGGNGVYLSVLLRPQGLSIPEAALITTAASVAVCRAVSSATGQEPRIKWVNDLFLHGKKICGILTEAVSDFESGNVEWIIVGAGLNYSHLPADFPPELRETAGSICPGSRDGAGRNRLAAETVNQLRRLPGMLADTSFLKEYQQRSLVLGKEILVLNPQETYEATALDIDLRGRLLIRRADNGAELALSAGEVSVRIQS